MLGDRDRIADLHERRVLEAGDEIADLAHAELVDRRVGGTSDTHLFDVGERLRGQHADLHALSDAAVHDAHERDDAAVGVEVRVEDERLERRVRITHGMRHVLHDGLERVLHTLARLAAREDRFVRRNRETLLDLVAHALRIRGGKVDLVDERDDLQMRVHRQLRVGDRLRLNALGRVHDEQHALARRERARHLVREVHVSRRVDEVQLVRLAIERFIVQTHGLRLDGDAALTLDIHRVEHLPIMSLSALVWVRSSMRSDRRFP